MLFDMYVMVDWSANGKPKTGKDSIWIAICESSRGTVTLQNPRTRQAAMDRIGVLLDEATAAEDRLLLGVDLPLGYPEGAARELAGQANWKAIWRRIAAVVEDHPNNRNNRFDAAAVLNTQFRGCAGPFWGNGLKRDIPGLTRKKPRVGWGENLPPRLRDAERLVPKAQEVWKLNGAGSVGGQALTGIARLEQLRQSRHDLRVWPFEELEGAHHVLAEIYPSLIDPCPGDEVLDARQVKAVAITIRELDKLGKLKGYLSAPNDMPERVRREEGLILGMHDQPGFRAAAAQAMSL